VLTTQQSLLSDAETIFFAEAFYDLVDWSYNTQLTSVYISLVLAVHDNFTTLQHHSPCILRALSEIISHHLRKFEIQITIMTPKDLDALDWDAIERVTLSPKYLSLQKFVICIVGGELDGAREWLHQKVPVLSKRAMIEGLGD